MKISDEQLYALIEEVERQGGSHVDGVHRPRTIKFEKDESIREPHEPRYKEGTTTGCGKPGVLMIHYDPAASVLIPAAKGKTEQHTMSQDELRVASERDAGYARVCAYDDNVIHWPRFRQAVD
jgi:hypothetical protein